MGRVVSGRKQEENVEVPKVNPGTSYKWEPEDEFILNGEEFAILLNTLRVQATTGGAPAKSIIDCHNILETLLVQGVEAGIIVEQSGPTQPIQSTEIIEGVPLP